MVRVTPDRILVVGNVTEVPFQNNLLPALRAFQKRAEVRLVEPRLLPDLPSTGGARPAALRREHLESVLAHASFDLVVCLAGGYFLPAGSRALFDAETVFAGFALSDPLGFEVSAAIAPEFDLFYTSDPQTVPLYASRGLTVRRCDPATDPELYRPLDLPRETDVLFLGKWTAERDAIVRALAARWRVRVHSYAAETRWSVPIFPVLPDPQSLCEALNRTKAILEFARLDEAPEPFRGTFRITNRPQFAACCETPALIDDFARLSQFFEPGVEIETFRGDAELLSRAERLLSDDARRREMGHRARLRVIRDHTWDARVGAVLDDVARITAKTRTRR